MLLREWVSLLKVANWATGIAFAAVATWRCVAQGLLGPLVLLIGLIVVGPVEDQLKARLPKQEPTPGDDVSQIIDQATSLVLILSLLIAVLLY